MKRLPFGSLFIYIDKFYKAEAEIPTKMRKIVAITDRPKTIQRQIQP